MESKIQKAIEETREERYNGDHMLLKPYAAIRPLLRRPNQSRAIKEFCRMCSQYSTADRNKCPIKDCPLWPWRQGKVYTSAKELKEWQDRLTITSCRIEPELFQDVIQKRNPIDFTEPVEKADL